MNIQDVQKFLEGHSWTYARTMPLNPHWYIVKQMSVDQGLFIEAVNYIQNYGVPGEFEGVTYKYLVIGEYKYWTMGSTPEETTIINRVSHFPISNKIEFINAKFNFSLYPNLLTVDKPLGNIDINELIEAIKYGYVKDSIAYLRGPISKDEYNSIKKESIPCVTLSGIFTHRAGSDLIKHSGLIQIDIDKVEDYDSVFHKLCTDEYIYVCFRSPGGNGLKAIVKINPSAETHKSQFKSLEIYFKKHFGVSIDSQCKDLARSMLLSYDPDIYCNPMSKVYAEMYIPPEYPRSKFKPASNVTEEKVAYSDDSVEVIESIISAIEKQHIDITSSYYNWIRIGFALCTTFGESGREYCHRIGRLYPNYTKEETDKIYTQLLANNNGRTTLGTIIFLSREAGINVSRKTDKEKGDR